MYIGRVLLPDESHWVYARRDRQTGRHQTDACRLPL